MIGRVILRWIVGGMGAGVNRKRSVRIPLGVAYSRRSWTTSRQKSLIRECARRIGAVPVQRGDIAVGKSPRLPARRESGAKTAVEIFQRASQPAGEVERLAKQSKLPERWLRADYEASGAAVPCYTPDNPHRHRRDRSFILQEISAR